jgi:hypothetical protein
MTPRRKRRQDDGSLRTSQFNSGRIADLNVADCVTRIGACLTVTLFGIMFRIHRLSKARRSNAPMHTIS